MKIIYYGTNVDILDEWRLKFDVDDALFCYDVDSYKEESSKLNDFILVADYDSVAHDINDFISSNILPYKTILLEKSPEISIGKMLIGRGVKAYGNSRMLKIHYIQMLNTVQAGKVWTYPELTAELSKTSEKDLLNDESLKMIANRLSEKEVEVTKLILQGFTNDAIASHLNIKTRTVKAHVSSIFSKMHVNDRISLVLLLK